jgi:uncharacterized repeat protein (TIGR01451 family)
MPPFDPRVSEGQSVQPAGGHPREGRLMRVMARSALALLMVLTLAARARPEVVRAIGTAPSLGTASSFAVLGGSTVTNTGPSIVVGDLGVSPGSAVVGFPPGVVVGGVIHAADAVALAAQADNVTAYNNLAGQACDTNLTGMDLGGMTLVPGVYCFSTSAFLSAGILTLDAGGDPDAVFIFKIGSTLITGSATSVLMINGAQACNVFWQVGSSATLGTTTAFAGNILALASVTLTTGATLLGRAFAQVGAVTMDSNVITRADCADVEGPDVELDLTKTDSPDPVIAGNLLTYVLTVTNNGTDPAENVTIVDNLPVGTTFVSATPSAGGVCNLVGSQVTCVWAGDTAPGGVRSVTIVVRVCSDVLCGTVLVNTAVASADFGLPDPATTSTTVRTQSDLSITKTQTSPAGNVVIAGQNVTYSIVVTNAGPSTSVNTIVTDVLGAGLRFVSANSTLGTCSAVGQTVTCNLGTLGAANQCATVPAPTTATITLVARVCPEAVCASVITNTATVSGGNLACLSNLPDPTPANNTSAPVNTTVQTQSDLSITKTQTSPAGNVVVAGQNVTYSIVVTNSGPSNSLNTVVTDVLSANLRFVSAVSTLGVCSAVGQTVTCNLGSMGPVGITQCLVGTPLPTTATITLVAQACPETACGSVISNTATVAGGPSPVCANNLADPTPANNTATVNTTVQTRADLSITKTQTSPAGNVVIAGQNVTYSIVVTNAGPSNSVNTVVTDVLGAGLSFVSATSTLGTCSAVGQTVTCNLGTVGPVGITQCVVGTPLPTSATITLVARACPDDACGSSVTNTATVTGGPIPVCASNLPDPTPANNTAVVNTTVQARSDLSITKSGAPNPATAGQNITYTVIVTNAGPSNSPNTVMVDTLPVQTTFVSATPTLGTCSHLNGVVTCQLGTLGPPGVPQCATGLLLASQVTITIVVNVRPDTPSSDPACGCNGAALVNVATVSGGTPACVSQLPDPTPANNSTTLNIPVRAGADVLMATPVIVSPDCFAPGDLVTVNQTFSNTGPCAVQGQPDGPGPEFEITFPAGVIGQPGSCVVHMGGGTCVITATQLTWNGAIPAGATISLGYQVRLQGGLTVGTLFCIPSQVHYDQCNVVGSGQRMATVCATVNCPPTVNPNQQLGRQVHLPILNFQGQDDVCRTMIEVQYIGCDPSKAVLVTWGEPGFCPPQAAGPLKVECTGLLFPGASWIMMGAQIPTGSKGGMLFKFTAQQLSEVGIDLGFDDVVADLMCETLFFGVVGDADDYRRFKKAYNEGLDFAGINQRVAAGEGILAVEVLRHCPGDVTPGVEVSSKYTGIAGTHLGTYDPVFGGFGYYVPLVYANRAGLNTVLYIQNGGLECSSLEIWFKGQDDCLRARICDVATLAPGETYQFDASDCVGPDWQGSAWIRASEWMGVAVDIYGRDILMTYIGEPAPFDFGALDGDTSPSTGEEVAYGPLIYSEYQGWDTGVQVMNLSPIVNAKVKIYFLDRSGDVITTLVDWICPRGSQTFFLPIVADLPGTWVGSTRVESQAWWTSGTNPVAVPDIVGVATLMKYGDVARTEMQQAMAYNLLPEHKAYSWQIGANAGGPESGVGLIAIPSLLKDLDGSGVTSEIAIMNLVQKPGFTDFAIFIFDQNGLLDYVCQKLHDRQVEYIDLQTWGYVSSGFKGSAIISATFWEHDVFDAEGFFLRSLLGLGAVSVERTGTRLGEDIPGDEAAGDRGIPFAQNDLLSFCVSGPSIPRCPGQPVFAAVNADFSATSTTVATIPNSGTGQLVQTVTVTGPPADCRVTDVDLRLDLSHSVMSELDVSLSHASATGEMFTDICASAAGFQQILDDDAATNVTACTSLTGAPATRRKTESGTGLNVFNGRPANGVWTLAVLDDFLPGLGSGSINGWSVTGTCRYRQLVP